MKKVLIAGASGVLGLEVLKQLQDHPEYWVRGHIRDAAKRKAILPYCDEVVLADARQPEQLKGICDDIEIVFSTIGKSVSLFAPEAGNFVDLDFRGNLNLLEEAKKAGVSRFVYTSIYGSETSPNLMQGWTQEMFAQNLMHTKLSHTIIKPVGMFSGLNDLIIMAKSGILMTPGNGKCLTNAIHPKDLASFCINHLQNGPQVAEVGGPEIHSRNEVMKMVAEATHTRLTMNIPLWIVKPGLMLVRLLNKNLYDKLSYFTYITTHDMVAPRYGKLTFKEYLDGQELQAVPS
ncbi:nucleoside-diphosphate-sugar epimerase [Catalinimonas alkaloidigena]|uniref:SDR family oxidoreductase n=1 Tax=Catalinimonas alkaloidigena TaxID=1075417 RepID=UPI0024057C82|nr:NAD(P)H-binding protein [Catalinimonas alkaloidigena]MDF9798242.1 nucleoside-diphosphate-sugar epimerase [Catalinimonas alkaloidigena]